MAVGPPPASLPSVALRRLTSVVPGRSRPAPRWFGRARVGHETHAIALLCWPTGFGARRIARSGRRPCGPGHRGSSRTRLGGQGRRVHLEDRGGNPRRDQPRSRFDRQRYSRLVPYKRSKLGHSMAALPIFRGRDSGLDGVADRIARETRLTDRGVVEAQLAASQGRPDFL